MGNRANSPVQAGDSNCPLPWAGGNVHPQSPGEFPLLWGRVKNLTSTTCTCLQPACPAHALCACHSTRHCITQGCSLLA